MDKLTDRVDISFRSGEKFKRKIKVEAAKQGLSISEATRRLWAEKLNIKIEK